MKYINWFLVAIGLFAIGMIAGGVSLFTEGLTQLWSIAAAWGLIISGWISYGIGWVRSR